MANTPLIRLGMDIGFGDVKVVLSKIIEKAHHIDYGIHGNFFFHKFCARKKPM
jgi:hypothetical protein